MFPPPSAIGKNKIFWRKIVIFHTKYSKHFRASLRSAQFLPQGVENRNILLWFKCVLTALHVNCIILFDKVQGLIQDFKLGGGALKKIAPSGGRRENVWSISCASFKIYVEIFSYFYITFTIFYYNTI
jgi:hypothetical protein